MPVVLVALVMVLVLVLVSAPDLMRLRISGSSRNRGQVLETFRGDAWVPGCHAPAPYAADDAPAPYAADGAPGRMPPPLVAALPPPPRRSRSTAATPPLHTDASLNSLPQPPIVTRL